MEEALKRYTATQRFEILQFLQELAYRTRRSKKISENRKKSIVVEWEGFDTDVVSDAIRLFMKIKTSSAQNERYIKGIMRNKQKEKEANLHGRRVDKGTGSAKKNISNVAKRTEGERLRELAGESCSTGGLECDF